MQRPSLCRPVLSIALLAACPSAGNDSATEPGPGTATDSTGSTATDTTLTTGGTGPTVTGEPTTSGTTTTVGSTTVGTTGDSTTGDSTTGLDTSTTAVDPSTTGLDTSTTDTTDTTDPGTTTTTTGTTGESSSTGDELPDTTGGELCGSNGGDVIVAWSLEVSPQLAGKDIDTSCFIVSSQVQGQEATLDLDCNIDNQQESVVLHYTVQPFDQYLWTDGGLVKLDYHTEPGPWDREWLKVTDVFTQMWAVRADSLAPPGLSPLEFYGKSVALAAPCDPEPDPCGSRQGLEVRIEYPWEGMDVFAGFKSGEAGSFGFPIPTDVRIAHASRLLEPIGCNDVAPRAIDMMIVVDHSGF